ncbi:MAG: restriction endonuclease subunit S [Thermodesulfobacteriota bacterium]|nr:restriction endonuclease subunit S [Thermodesulfobacteriota bacterium]
MLKACQLTGSRVNTFMDTRFYVSTGDVDGNDVLPSVSVTFDDRPSRADLVVKDGDILFARMQSTDKVVLVTGAKSNYIWSTGFAALRPKQGTNSRWVSYWLKSQAFQERKNALCTGATQKAITNDAIRELSIPIPPISEQERISQILDEVEAIQLLRTNADDLTAMTIAAAFFNWYGDPNTNAQKLPTAKLGDIAKLERGKFTPRPRNDPSYFDGEYPFIQTGDISNSDGLLSTWRQTLNERGKAVSKEFPAGTIVFAIVGATIGATAILQVPMYCTDSIVGIQVNPKYCFKEYIEFVLRTRRSILLAQAPDAARANLNLEILRDLLIPLPPLESQVKVVEHINKIRALQAAQTASRKRLADLFQSLLHRAFQGEL